MRKPQSKEAYAATRIVGELRDMTQSIRWNIDEADNQLPKEIKACAWGNAAYWKGISNGRHNILAIVNKTIDNVMEIEHARRAQAAAKSRKSNKSRKAALRGSFR